MLKNRESTGPSLLISILLILLILTLTFSLTIFIAYKLNILNLAEKIDEKISTFAFVRTRIERKQTESVDRDRMITEVADYYQTKDVSYVTEAMYGIKLKDSTLYLDILKKLNKNMAKEVEGVISKRDRKIDFLSNLYEDVKLGKNEQLESKVRFYQKLEPVRAADSIIGEISNSPGSLKEVGDILKTLKIQNTVEILYYLEENIKQEILSQFSLELRDQINKQLFVYQNAIDNLRDAALLYQTMEPEKASQEIGNELKYNLRDLLVIYNTIEPQKAASILSFAEEDFRLSVLSGLEHEKSLTISKELERQVNYGNRVIELSQIYERMSVKDSSKLIEQLYAEEPKLTIDVMRKMKTSTAAQILKEINSKAAVNISKELTTN